MSLQKYRADRSETQADGAIVWRTDSMFYQGPAKVTNCRAVCLHGSPRLTAYITGEPDTYFSIPAKAYYLGCVINGYITTDDAGNLVFHHCYY